MRATLAESASLTRVIERRWRLVLVFFEVRMWRILDWPRLNLPVPVFLKRLAAPECVFNFGIGVSYRMLLLDNLPSIAEFQARAERKIDAERWPRVCCPSPRV